MKTAPGIESANFCWPRGLPQERNLNFEIEPFIEVAMKISGELVLIPTSGLANG